MIAFFFALDFITWGLKYLRYLHLAQCLTHVLCDMLLPSCPILCNPTDCSPPGFSIYGDSPGKNAGVACHALLQRIFLAKGSNRVAYISCLGRWVLYHWCHLGSPDTWQVHKIYLSNKCLNRGRENMTSHWDCKIFEERRLWRFFGVFNFPPLSFQQNIWVIVDLIYI